MQPFTRKTAYIIIIGVASYYCCWYLFDNIHGFSGMVLKSTLFMILFGSSAFLLRLSPDMEPVLSAILKRMGIKKGDHRSPWYSVEFILFTTNWFDPAARYEFTVVISFIKTADGNTITYAGMCEITISQVNTYMADAATGFKENQVAFF